MGTLTAEANGLNRFTNGGLPFAREEHHSYW